MPPGVSLTSSPPCRAASGRQFLADALAGFTDRFDGAEIERALVDQRFDELEEGGAGLALSGGDARLDQHLLLPVAGALAVVKAGAFLGDGDLSQGSVGAEAQVDAIALALGGVAGEQGGVLVGHLLVEFLVGEHGGTVGLAIAAVDEHEVDIGAVVQLFAAQLAERDDAEAAQGAIFEAGLAVARH